MLALVLVTLGFGWWPLSFRLKNDVVYSPEAKALAFNSMHEAGVTFVRGIAFYERDLDTRSWPGVTILVELRGRSNGSGLGVFLEFFEEEELGLPSLLVSQWQTHLALRSRRDEADVARGYSEIGHREMFSSGEFTQLLMCSERGRTRVYVDGQIVESRSDFPLIGPDNKFAGRLAIGNSSDGKRPFTGEIRRVTIYDGFYRAGSSRLANAKPVIDLDFRAGAIPSGLEVPGHFVPGKRRFFNSVGAVDWEKPGYRSDIVVNALGFIPVGICFAAVARRRARSFFAVLTLVGLASFSLSLLIEWGQGYLVHRDSSQLDIMLNTASGMLAVLVPKRWILFL